MPIPADDSYDPESDNQVRTRPETKQWKTKRKSWIVKKNCTINIA